LEAEFVEVMLDVAPAFHNLDKAAQVDPHAKQLFTIKPGGRRDLFQHLAAFTDDHALVAFALTADQRTDIDKVASGPFFEAFNGYGYAMGDFLPHEEQDFFADQFGHQFLFRHIGKSVVVKIMGARLGVAAQRRKKRFASGTVLRGNRQHLCKDTKGFDLLFARFQRGKILEKVNLVDHSDCRSLAAKRFDHR